MGCAKNVVDSEKLMAQLKLSDIEITPRLEDADIAVINTCGFIEAAKQESIDMIIENVRLKASGKLKKVYAMGCLTERYMMDLQKEIPEVDRFFGSHEMPNVLKELGADEDIAREAAAAADETAMAELANEAPIVKFVNLVLAQAVGADTEHVASVSNG